MSCNQVCSIMVACFALEMRMDLIITRIYEALFSSTKRGGGKKWGCVKNCVWSKLHVVVGSTWCSRVSWEMTSPTLQFSLPPALLGRISQILINHQQYGSYMRHLQWLLQLPKQYLLKRLCKINEKGNVKSLTNSQRHTNMWSIFSQFSSFAKVYEKCNLVEWGFFETSIITLLMASK